MTSKLSSRVSNCAKRWSMPNVACSSWLIAVKEGAPPIFLFKQVFEMGGLGKLVFSEFGCNMFASKLVVTGLGLLMGS